MQQLYVYLLETRVCNDNPDLGRDQVLRRCASDAKFASGATLVDALFGFGLYMGQDDIRAAYLEALVGEITDVSASSRAAAWLGLLLRQPSPRMGRASTCSPSVALADWGLGSLCTLGPATSVRWND